MPKPTMLKMTILTFAAALLVATAVAVAFSQTTTSSSPKYHVVFQMSEPEGQAWDSLILHVNNTRASLGKENSQMEVVFFGPGLNMLLKKNSAFEARLKDLSDSGVKLIACQNAMRYRNVASADLFPFATEVDSAIAEMVRKQQAGWQYVH
jgi:intracellular sulfur oxidation DsrE/DsrF family protein